MFKFLKKVDYKKQIAELQNTVNILTQIESTSNVNPYANYDTAIAELAKKYEGVAENGVQQIRNIIDVRSAFIIGNGIKLVADNRKEAQRSLEFLESFIKHNNLDEEMPQELVKEAEIEGRCLVKLFPNKDNKNIDLRYISYSTNKYKILTAPDDYQKYTEAVYRVPEKSEDVRIKEPDFIYKKFAGRLHKVNDVMPKTAMVLKECETIDKALIDWRKINHIFSAPTPYFKCQNAQEATQLKDYLKEINWKIGKMVITTADFQMRGLTDNAGINALKEEIITNAKIISGATGVPVHFLGLPDLMSNRSTSHDMFEFITASTNKETETWTGFYEEVFNKAIRIYNSAFQAGLPENLVKCRINKFTESQMKQLVEVWLPLYGSRVITLKDMLSKIPDVDVDQALKEHDQEGIRMLDGIKTYEQNQFQEEA